MQNTSPAAPDTVSEATTYQTGVLQSAAYRNLKKLTNALLEPHDLTMTQWFMLGTICDAGERGISVTDLAFKVDTGLPYVTNMVNLFESKGIAVRRESKTDNRVKRVHITTKYAKRCQDIETQLRADMRAALYPAISSDELDVYVAVLRKLAAL